MATKRINRAKRRPPPGKRDLRVSQEPFELQAASSLHSPLLLLLLHHHHHLLLLLLLLLLL